jgi:thiosulfate/3-mercaptopyruvate sulfurtransferase
VAQDLSAPNTRLVEVDVDTTAYDQGHIPGVVGWNWQTQLQDNIRRDLIDRCSVMTSSVRERRPCRSGLAC